MRILMPLAEERCLRLESLPTSMRHVMVDHATVERQNGMRSTRCPG